MNDVSLPSSTSVNHVELVSYRQTSMDACFQSNIEVFPSVLLIAILRERKLKQYLDTNTVGNKEALLEYVPFHTSHPSTDSFP